MQHRVLMHSYATDVASVTTRSQAYSTATHNTCIDLCKMLVSCDTKSSYSTRSLPSCHAPRQLLNIMKIYNIYIIYIVDTISYNIIQHHWPIQQWLHDRL